MSHLLFTANSLLSVLQQAPVGARTLLLRGRTVQSRSFMRDVLPDMLARCGCGAPVLTETATRLTLCFDLPLEAALAVYAQTVAMGLELDGESHFEWTRLCTVQKHVDVVALDWPCTVRLELRFSGEKQRAVILPPAARA